MLSALRQLDDLLGSTRHLQARLNLLARDLIEVHTVFEVKCDREGNLVGYEIAGQPGYSYCCEEREPLTVVRLIDRDGNTGVDLEFVRCYNGLSLGLWEESKLRNVVKDQLAKLGIRYINGW